jgi:hypothetical protein
VFTTTINATGSYRSVPINSVFLRTPGDLKEVAVEGRMPTSVAWEWDARGMRAGLWVLMLLALA